MSDSMLNALLRPAAPSQPRGTDVATARDASADSSFSRALERRMSAGEREAPQLRREPAAAAREARRDTPPARERGVAERGRESAAAQRRHDAGETPRASGGGPTTGANASASRTDVENAHGGAPADEAPSAAPAPASDAAAAASLAALLPNVAVATQASAESGEPDSGPGGPQGLQSGATILEKLIAEASGSSGDGAADGATDVLGGAQWKPASGPLVADASVRMQDPAAASRFAGAPAAALQPMSADAAGGVAAPAFAPAARIEQSPPQLPVATPAAQPEWADDVGGRVLWMVGRNESKAELVLTPPSLGKLEVSLHVGADQTTAHFVAATAAARDALEQAMPRLREVLQQAGIQLGDANVSTSGDQQAHEHGSDRSGGGSGRSAGFGDAGAEPHAAARPATWVPAGRGVVDTFA